MEGTRLGPYLLGRKLGAGGMATVYEGTVEGTAPGLRIGDRVAVKVVHPHLLTTPGFFERFLREIDVGKSIRHENVVRTFDASASREEGDERKNFMVMELVEGQTLRGLMRELGWVPEDLCRHIGREVSKALEAIHGAGIIHRDLKPENVLITREDVVKVMDLGVARLQDEALRLSQTGQFVGSVMYAAPEQFKGGGKGLDGRLDLYALGLTLYELAGGVNPFRDDNFASVVRRQLTEDARPLSEVNPQISPFFEEVLTRLMKKEREERFDSATDLLEVLEDGEESLWWRKRSGEIREETKRPLRRVRIPRDTTLYGREREIERLRQAWGLAKTGEGGVLLVEGEAGIGKTRLVDEFAATLEAEGEEFNFLFGSYPPGGAATGAGAFNTAYREHFGADGLEDRLGGYLTVTPALVPAFAAFLRGEPPPKGEEPLTKDSIQTVFVHATRALAEERPTIVLIDDLHFAPEEGLALFAALSLAVPGHRILLVGTARPDLSERWKTDLDGMTHTSRLFVDRLREGDLTRLLVEAFSSQRVAEDLAPRIATKTDGNPFFVFEVIRGLREGQFVTQKDDGTWAMTQVIKDIEIPSSVKDLVAARIADLSEEERDLLDVAACCGFEFDPVLVGEALGMGRIPTLRRLGHLEKDHRIVRSSGRRYVFDHHQMQEVLYEGLNELLREEYHAALGDVLEEISGAAETDREELDGALAVELSEHFLKGARGEQALAYLEPALSHLEQAYRNAHAIELADRALSVAGLLSGGERLEVLLRKSGPLELTGRWDEEEEVLREAVDLAESGGEAGPRARAHRLLGGHYWLISRFESAREELEKAEALAREAGDRAAEAGAIGSTGNVFLRLSRYDEARARYERQLEIAREIGDRKEEGRATCNLGIIAFRQGRYEEAGERYEEYLAISKEIGDRKGEANAAANLGIMYHATYRPEEARPWVERQLEIAREIGDRRAEGMASGSLGLVLKELGRLTQSRERHERHREIAREIGDRRGEGIATGNLGLVLKRLGRLEESRECHERHLEIARETGDRRGESTAMLSLATTLEALGRWDEARAMYEEELAFARKHGDRGSEVLSVTNLGLLLGHLGQGDAARERLTEAKELGEALKAPPVTGTALLGLGHAAWMEADREEARSLVSEGTEILAGVDEKGGRVEGLLMLGRLDYEGGLYDDAEARFREAVGVAAELGEPGPLVLSRCWLAALAFDSLGEARELFEANEVLLEARVRMEAHFALHLAVGDALSIEEAHRLLLHLRDHAPADCREAMMERVPLHRAILSAWRTEQMAEE